MTEAEIIVEMRKALDILKQKWQEECGAGRVVDFMGAALDESHWMNTIVAAEQLSQPYVEADADYLRALHSS